MIHASLASETLHGDNHRHTYKFCMKYSLHVSDYKQGNGAKLETASDKCNAVRICTKLDTIMNNETE
jgi:hypothetical protein